MDNAVLPPVVEDARGPVTVNTAPAYGAPTRLTITPTLKIKWATLLVMVFLHVGVVLAPFAFNWSAFGVFVILQGITALGITLFAPMAKRFGWQPKRSDSHLDAMLRTLAIGRLGQYGEKTTVDRARQAFREFVKNG